jgi:hypothetical protein
MTADTRDGDGNFLRRWSQRKLAAARQAGAADPSAPPAPAPPVTSIATSGASVAESRAVAAPLAATAATPAREEAPALPPVDSLTFDSDFTGFLSPKVDEAMKRQALRKLFADPRFNVMDGLDVYIDDYSKFEPIPEDLIGKLAHARYIFDPPKTRVNEAGHVEDVPDEPPQAVADAEARAEGDARIEADAGAGADASAGTGAERDGAAPTSADGNEATAAQAGDSQGPDGARLPEPAVPPAGDARSPVAPRANPREALQRGG